MSPLARDGETQLKHSPGNPVRFTIPKRLGKAGLEFVCIFGHDGLALATVFEYPGLDLERLSLAVSMPAVPAAAERLDVL